MDFFSNLHNQLFMKQLKVIEIRMLIPEAQKGEKIQPVSPQLNPAGTNSNLKTALSISKTNNSANIIGSPVKIQSWEIDYAELDIISEIGKGGKLLIKPFEVILQAFGAVYMGKWRESLVAG